MAVPVPNEARELLITLAKRKQDDQARIADVLCALGTLPEFQLN